MNWLQIKEQYPKAFTKYLEWSQNAAFLRNGVMHTFEGGFFDSVLNRELYDFFDSESIYCQTFVYDCGRFGIKISMNFDGKKIESAYVSIRDDKRYEKSTITKNRTDSENVLFTKAFDFLEYEINKK